MSVPGAYTGKLENIRLIAGRSNNELGQLISRKLGIPLAKARLETFPNGEVRVEIHENIRGTDVFILQTGVTYEGRSINDHIMELIALIRACNLSSVNSVTALIPYFPYCRSDKKDNPRVAIMARTVIDMFELAGVNRFVCVDLHAGQIQGFASKPLDNLFCLKLFSSYMREQLFNGLTQEQINEQFVLVSPDNGGVKRIEAYAKELKMKHIIMHKQRDHSKTSVVDQSIIIGDINAIKGKTAIVIDDMIDTMGTMVSAAKELTNYGIKEVIVMATHGIFSDPAFDRINGCKEISRVVVTNTLPQEKNSATKCNKLICVDISWLLSETIRRLVIGGSISELFI